MSRQAATTSAVHRPGDYPDLPSLPGDFSWGWLEANHPVAAIELLDMTRGGDAWSDG